MTGKLQDVFSGSVHPGEAPEAAHVDRVDTGWCVRLEGQSEQGEDGTEVAWTPFLLICTQIIDLDICVGNQAVSVTQPRVT